MRTESLTLEKTVFARGRFIREVCMRAPTQADIDEAYSAGDCDGERGFYLLAKLCNIPFRALRKMDDNDVVRLGAMYDRLAV